MQKGLSIWKAGVTTLSLASLLGCTGLPNTQPGASAGQQPTGNHGATVRLHLSTVQGAGMAGYRTQAETIRDLTPSVFLNKLKVRLATAEYGMSSSTAGQVFSLYEGTAPIDLAAGAASVSAAINAAAIPVAAGTYSTIFVDMDRTFTFAGQTQIGDTTYYTNDATASDTGTPPATVDNTVGPAAPYTFTLTGVPSKVLHFPKPLVLKDGDNVVINLLYDLTGAIAVDATAPGTNDVAGKSAGFGLKYIPMFALAGDVPAPEYYDIRIDDPQHLILDGSNYWHFHMTLFADKDSGAMLGLQCLEMNDPGSPSAHGAAGNFVSGAENATLNPDGSYRLVGATDPATHLPEFLVEAFRRETHDGVLSYHRIGSDSGHPAMADPATLSYHCTKVSQ